MKIAVTGKGGVGKTTFSATLARLYADEGRKVLAADVDPDANPKATTTQITSCHGPIFWMKPKIIVFLLVFIFE